MQGRACGSCGAFFSGAEGQCRFCGAARHVAQGTAFNAAVQAAVRQDLNHNGIPDILEAPPPSPQELAQREAARKARSQVETAFFIFIMVITIPVAVMGLWMGISSHQRTIESRKPVPSATPVR